MDHCKGCDCEIEIEESFDGFCYDCWETSTIEMGFLQEEYRDLVDRGCSTPEEFASYVL